jgi:hypothetical protein
LTLTNGDSETGPNGIATPRPEADEEKADPRDDVIELETESSAAILKDAEKAAEKAKEKAKAAAASLLSANADQEDKDKVWEKNGYAHAPLWPQVRSSPSAPWNIADGKAPETPLFSPPW